MTHLINKDDLVSEIKHHLQFTPEHTNAFIEGEEHAYRTILSFLDTLEVKDPYEQCVQYDSIKAKAIEDAESLVEEVDLEKEINKWIEDNTCRGYCSASIRETAEHFFERGLKAQKV